jgi:hypothetical protein
MLLSTLMLFTEVVVKLPPLLDVYSSLLNLLLSHVSKNPSSWLKSNVLMMQSVVSMVALLNVEVLLTVKSQFKELPWS